MHCAGILAAQSKGKPNHHESGIMTLTRLLFIGFAILIGGAAALGLAVLSGHVAEFTDRDLTARVVVSDFQLPTGFGIDPNVVATYRSDAMQLRAEGDVALRLGMAAEGLAQRTDVPIPRLVNTGTEHLDDGAQRAMA